MPMAEELGGRYRALFRTYGTGGNAQMVRLKAQIAERENTLREDAMYFLLTSMDHMVIRAFSGYLPDVNSTRLGSPMARYVEPAEVDNMISKSLQIIFDELAEHRTEGTKSSANAVVRAINVKHEELADTILWWRE